MRPAKSSPRGVAKNHSQPAWRHGACGFGASADGQIYEGLPAHSRQYAIDGFKNNDKSEPQYNAILAGQRFNSTYWPSLRKPGATDEAMAHILRRAGAAPINVETAAREALPERV